MNKDEIRKGIASYKREQSVLIRLLKKRGGFTDVEFDRWFKNREFRRRVPLRGGGICGDSFILGLGVNGMNMWAEYLELLQHMIRLDMVDAKRNKGGILYSLVKEVA